MQPLKAFGFFCLVLFFLSCQKDNSNEDSVVAGGTLTASGSGECLPSSVQGSYIAGTTLTAGNFINVTVNITATGTYNISTNTINGYKFSTEGTATAIGQQVIKLTGSGTPVSAGANTFNVQFGSSTCSITVNVMPAATPVAVFSTINCPGIVLAGTYQQGTATGSGNTVQIPVTVTTAGTYEITTNTVNGVSFSGSGYLGTGTHMVTLTANGGTPANSGVVAYTVTAGTNSCNFNITYTPVTPPPGVYTWSFKAGTTLYSGITQVSETVNSPASITVWGPNTAGAEFELRVTDRTPGASIATGIYPGISAPGIPSGKYTWSLYFTGGTPEYRYYTGYGAEITTNITVLNTTTKIIEGTFSGTARQGNEETGPIVTITEGVFKARLP